MKIQGETECEMCFIEEIQKFVENMEEQYREAFLDLAKQIDAEEGLDLRTATPYNYLSTRKWKGSHWHLCKFNSFSV